MSFIKLKKHLAMKIFTITVLSVFVLGISSVPVHTYDNSDAGQGLTATEDALAETLVLTIHVAHLDISPEEKVEILANALGWNSSEPLQYDRTIDAVTTATPRVCNQYLLAAIIADTLDNFFPPIGFAVFTAYCLLLTAYYLPF